MPGYRTWLRSMLLSVAIIACWPAVALACRCTEPNLRDAYRQATGIVWGEIVSVRKESEYNAFYEVEVLKAWKLNAGQRITIRSGGTCIFPVAAGDKYLLYLRPYTAGTYQTSRCMGNKPEAAAARALKFLRRQ